MEIEAKYTIPDKQTHQQLQTIQQVNDFAFSDAHPQNITDTYLDTPDRRILNAGYACRLRQPDNAEQCSITLKALTPVEQAIHRREELELTLPRPLPPHQWPRSAVQDKILSIVKDSPLETLFELRQHRQKRLVHYHNKIIAELSLDTVHQVHRERTQTYLELEVELKADGTEQNLQILAAYLQQNYELCPQPLSKFERGLNFTQKAPNIAAQNPIRHHISEVPDAQGARVPPSPDITPDDTMIQAAQNILYSHFQKMLAHEAGTLLGEDSEELHKMRVATRRMRAALRVFRAHLNKQQIKPYRRALKCVTQVLGTVRDLDVFREKTQTYRESIPTEKRPDLDPLMQMWQCEHKKARHALCVYLTSEAHQRFKEEFTMYLAQPFDEPAHLDSDEIAPLPQRVRHIAPIAIYQRLAEVRAYDMVLLKPNLPWERYHQLRIATKRLRYTLEFFQQALSPEVQQAISETKKLQDHLGDLQDTIVISNRLQNFQRWGRWEAPKETTSISMDTNPVIAPGVASYYAAKQAEIQHLLSTFPQVWAKLQGTDFRQCIAQAIQTL